MLSGPALRRWSSPRAALALRGIAAVTSGLLACDEAARGPVGVVRVALDEATCADYCLAEMRATLFREVDEALPIGPALQIGCGESIGFGALPAGERVVVALEGYDLTGEVLLRGRSEPVTIIADGVAQARVTLVGEGAPTLASLDPDPLVAALAPAEVTLHGTFGGALGKAQIEVGAVAYGPDAWRWDERGADDRITLTLPLGARGGDVRVRRCGIASAPRELRVVGATLGVAAASGAACPGALARALVADAASGVAHVAWSCGDGGVLLEMRADEALCPLDPGLSWSLASPPAALALHDGEAFVGGEAGLGRVALEAGASVRATAVTEPVHALAASDGEVYAIVGAPARLAKVGGGTAVAVEGLDAALVPVALAGAGATMWVAAYDGTAGSGAGDGRLVAVPGSGGPTTYALVGADDCPTPRAIAVGADAVALACSGGGLLVRRVAAQTFERVDVPALAALAFDGDDVVVALADDGALVLVKPGSGGPTGGSEGRVLHSFAGAAPPSGSDVRIGLAALGAHRFAAPHASAPLAVLTPYDGAGPCPAGAP